MEMMKVNPQIEQNMEMIIQLIHAIYFPDATPQQMQAQYNDQASQLVVGAITFLEQNELEVNYENILNNKDAIWQFTFSENGDTGGTQITELISENSANGECACKRNAKDIADAKKFGIIALAILILLIFFK